MKTIRILSESAAVGKRLRDILYQAGFSDVALSGTAELPQTLPDGIAVIYVKSRISDTIRAASGFGCPVVLLLNPDCYAMYIDRARHAGITLLLMPIAPYMLLDAVKNAESL